MYYHNITHDDMRNGDGLRVVLWVAGCEHHCKGCQNPMTWNPTDGKQFTCEEAAEIAEQLEEDYISGLTLSGGDPLHPANVAFLTRMCQEIKEAFPEKTIWCYTGYEWEEVKHYSIMEYIDVLVDGRYVESLKDNNYPWAGSTNQKVIDVQKSLLKGGIVLYESH